MQAHILSLHTLRLLELGQKTKTYFTESSHVAFQIKGSGTQSTMQAHILSLHTSSTLRWDQKVQTFVFAESGHVAF